ncbi:MAG: hypothetical protein HYV51_02420 [Parcubacteria group bacterium]|nr:hypothetical protein [Parcubacteria group bacterium]
MKNLPMKRYNGGNGHVITQQQEFGSLNDRVLQENIAALKESRKELEGINKLVKKALDLPSDRKRSIIAKFLNYLVPTSWYESLPSSVIKLMAEENDVLELIETLMRSNIDSVQDALRELAACAITKREELNTLEADLGVAQKENWDAQALQEYITSKAEIQVYDVVARLLDIEFNALTAEEKEIRKNDLLDKLRSTVVIGGELMETIGKVCSAGLQVFHRGVTQYYDYVNFYRPISVIRDSARNLIEMNHSMYAAKDALIATFRTSLQAIELAVDAANMVNNYSIASSDMKGLLSSGRARLDQKLKALEVSNRSARPAMLAPSAQAN